MITLPVSAIVPDPDQHRKDFDAQKLQELADSILHDGLQQPITVRPVGPGRYMIIAGERRWRAHNLAGLINIKSIVQDVDEKTARRLQIIENVQRADINPIEEANAYKQLLDDNPGWTSVDVGRAVGKTWNHVDTRLALCELHPHIQAMVRSGHITVGQGYEMVRASRLLAERDGEGVFEVQFRILRAVKDGQKISDVCRAITLQVAVQSQVAMFSPDDLPNPNDDERLKQARETVEHRIEKLERLCADTWDYEKCRLVVSAFTGNLETIVTRIELIEKHLARMRRDLQGERTRRQLERGAA